MSITRFFDEYTLRKTTVDISDDKKKNLLFCTMVDNYLFSFNEIENNKYALYYDQGVIEEFGPVFDGLKLIKVVCLDKVGKKFLFLFSKYISIINLDSLQILSIIDVCNINACFNEENPYVYSEENMTEDVITKIKKSIDTFVDCYLDNGYLTFVITSQSENNIRPYYRDRENYTSQIYLFSADELNPLSTYECTEQGICYSFCFKDNHIFVGFDRVVSIFSVNNSCIEFDRSLVVGHNPVYQILYVDNRLYTSMINGCIAWDLELNIPLFKVKTGPYVSTILLNSAADMAFSYNSEYTIDKFYLHRVGEYKKSQNFHKQSVGNGLFIKWCSDTDIIFYDGSDLYLYTVKKEGNSKV